MTKLSAIDRDAMRLAIEIVRAENHGRRDQIDSKLREDGFQVTGRFAAFYCQTDSLGLLPWQVCPCWIDDIDDALRLPPDDPRGEYRAASLLQRMLAAGLSKYDPDPLASLDRCEAERVRA